MAYSSPRPDVPIPTVSFVDLLFENAARHGDKTAIVDGFTHRAVTYHQLVGRIRQIAAGLASMGVRAGDVIAVQGLNSPDYAATFYAIISLGATITSLNPLYNVAELTYQLLDSRPRLVVLTSPATAKFSRAAEKAGSFRIVSLDELDALGAGASGSPEAPPQAGRDPAADVASLTYSNAAADVLMGVMLTHRNLVANIVQAAVVNPLSSDEVLLGLTPFCQTFGMVVVSTGLYAGATVVMLPHFDLRILLEAMHRYKVTSTYLIPQAIRALAKHRLVNQFDLSSLRHITSMTAPLPESVSYACAQRLGCVIDQAYGLTEAVAFTHFTRSSRQKSGSLGPPAPNTSFRIVDVASMTDVPTGKLGEVWVSGPQVMKGYHNHPEVTEQVLDTDGWLHTSDLGFADDDGRLHIVDRSKKLARLRGLHNDDSELLRTAVEDIAARREADERRRLQAVLLDAARESVVSTDLESKVTFWNKGAERLFGYTAEEAMRQPVESLIVPAGTEFAPADKKAALRANGTWNAQVQRRRKDGALLWTDLVVSIVRNAAGEQTGFLGIHRDISEQKRVEELLKDSHERLRNLATRLIAVREHERSSIARELHDELGQALTRLNIDLSWLMDRMPARLVTKRVHGMRSLVDMILKSVQHLSSELRPAILDDLGLEAAIESHVQDFAEWSGCRCVLNLRMQRLPRHRERDITVFRILQEALTNVARHARAEIVKVRTWTEDGQLVLEVEDDGLGIRDVDLGSSRSLGLIGMRERAESLGGRLQIARGEHGGTIVSLAIDVLERVPEGAAP